MPGNLSWIPGSKAQDPRIPRAKISRIREFLGTFISPGDKNPEIENIKPKNPSIIPVIWNPDYPPHPASLSGVGMIIDFKMVCTCSNITYWV